MRLGWAVAANCGLAGYQAIVGLRCAANRRGAAIIECGWGRVPLALRATKWGAKARLGASVRAQE